MSQSPVDSPVAHIIEPERAGRARKPPQGLARGADLVPALIAPPRTRELLASLDEATQNEILETMARALSPGSRRIYASCARIFVQWCIAHGRAPLPAETATVLAFMSDRSRTCKAAHVERYLTTIRYLHVAHGFAAPKHDSFYLLLRGLRKQERAIVRKAPLRLDALTAMSDLMDEDEYEARATRDRAILLFGWAGAMRRSELVALNIEDLTFDRRGVEVLIRRSKTDQRGEGQRIAVAYGQRTSTCPVRALQRWIRMLGRNDGPLFVALDGQGRIQHTRLSAQIIALRIKHYVKAIGLDPRRYAGHSLRAGFVTACVEARMPPSRIRLVTRHKYNAGLMAYIREASPWIDNTTQRIGL